MELTVNDLLIKITREAATDLVNPDIFMRAIYFFTLASVYGDEGAIAPLLALRSWIQPSQTLPRAGSHRERTLSPYGQAGCAVLRCRARIPAPHGSCLPHAPVSWTRSPWRDPGARVLVPLNPSYEPTYGVSVERGNC